MDNSASNSIPFRVLIVDDHPVMRRILRAHFMGIGCDVAEAASASEGRQALSTFQPSLVTLDVIMAPVDGITSLDLLRATQQSPECVAFMVTGVVSYEERQLYLGEGAEQFFMKPVLVAHNFEPLLSAIQQMRYSSQQRVADDDLESNSAPQAV